MNPEIDSKHEERVERIAREMCEREADYFKLSSEDKAEKWSIEEHAWKARARVALSSPVLSEIISEKVGEETRRCAYIIKGWNVNGYRTWPEIWPESDRAQNSELVRFCDDAAEAIRSRSPTSAGEVSVEGGEEIEGFASQMWGLSIFARTQLKKGDVEGALKTLGKLRDEASRKCPLPPTPIVSGEDADAEREYREREMEQLYHDGEL